MRTRMIAIALCLVMVSAFVVTNVVSARDAGQSNIRQYNFKLSDLIDGTQYVFGKIIVNTETGAYVANGNILRWDKEYGHSSKDVAKTDAGYTTPIHVINGFVVEPVGLVTIDNGGNIHGQGTLTQHEMDVLNQYGDLPDTWIVFPEPAPQP